jgi:hypothetical protein
MVPNHRKRKEIRVEATLPLLISKICIGEDKVAELDKLLPMKMINLSASVVLLYSPLNLPQFVRLFLNLHLGNEIVPCLADIVRKEHKEDGYYYGCNLFVTSENDKSRIRKYVFKKQVESRMNEKVN